MKIKILDQILKILTRSVNRLSQLNKLKEINLVGNNLGSYIDNMKIISDFLRNNKTIEI